MNRPKIYYPPQSQSQTTAIGPVSTTRPESRGGRPGTGAMSPSVRMKLRGVGRRYRPTNTNKHVSPKGSHYYHNEQQHQQPQYYQSHLPFPQQQQHHQQFRPTSNTPPSKFASKSQQKATLRNMLRRKNSSLVRTGTNRSPRPGSLRGLPYSNYSQTAPGQNQSPVMLVRKRSSTRSIRGSPIKRFFRKLFRRRQSKVKYFFNKSQLQRQLSFEIRESPSKSVKYEVKGMQLMNLKPQVRRMDSKTYSEPKMYSPKPTHAADAAKSSSLLENAEQDFKEFDFDYRDKLANRAVKAHQDTKEFSEPTGFQRKRSLVNRKKSTASSNLPLIRRVDLYDNPNPAIELEPRGSSPDRDVEEPIKVDEALAFVETWSSYLRRAVAVRVLLRQEIHSIEQEEEEKWQRQQQQQARRSLSTTSSSSLYSTSSSDTTATTASLDSSTNDDDDGDDASSGLTPTQKFGYDSSVSHGYESSLGHSYSISTNSTFEPTTRPIPATSATPANNTNNASSVFNTVEHQNRVQAIRESLEQGRMYQKYSSLMTRPKSYIDPPTTPSLGSGSGSTERPRPVSQQHVPRPRQTSEFRYSTDSLASLSKPDRESSWMANKPSRPASLSMTKTRVARPLPDIPVSKPSRVVSGPAIFNSQQFTQPPQHAVPQQIDEEEEEDVPPPVPPKDTHRQQRTMSDKILQDMYQELEELQQRSAQLSNLVKTQQQKQQDKQQQQSRRASYQYHRKRDSAIETHSRSASVSSVMSNGTSGSGAELARGKDNRRRPRSKVYLNQRASLLETPWTIQAKDFDDDSDNHSEDSGVTFGGSPTQWRSSVGKHPLLIEVGDISRPPSASETRFM